MPTLHVELQEGGSIREAATRKFTYFCHQTTALPFVSKLHKSQLKFNYIFFVVHL